MKKQFVLPLAAMLIATPIWARQHHGGGSSISVSTTALSFNGSTGNVTTQPLTITAAGWNSVTIQGVSISNGVFTDSISTMPMTLSPGQSVTVKVSATPQSTAQTGTLTITSTANDPSVRSARRPPPHPRPRIQRASPGAHLPPALIRSTPTKYSAPRPAPRSTPSSAPPRQRPRRLPIAPSPPVRPMSTRLFRSTRRATSASLPTPSR